MPAFLSRSRDGVKADVSIKDGGHSAQYSLKAIRHKRAPVRRLDVEKSDNNDKEYYDDLEYDEEVRGFFAFLDSDISEYAYETHNDKGWEVNEDVFSEQHRRS